MANPARRHGAEVSAGTLDPQHAGLLTGERIGLGDLRRGVAPAVVGDPKVGPQEIGAIEKQPSGVERSRPRVVPTVFDWLDHLLPEPTRASANQFKSIMGLILTGLRGVEGTGGCEVAFLSRSPSPR